MSNESKAPDPSAPGDGDPKPAGNGPATTGAHSEAPAAATGPTACGEAAALRAEIEEMKARLDRALRAYAEADNIRKRLEREKEDAAKYAVTRLARDVVDVCDNFQRAIATAPKEALEQEPALKAFLDGIKLTERDLVGALDRHGVRRIEPLGEQFNPRLHQAMMEVDDPSVGVGTILQVFQAGYKIEDRVLRPAMVVVAKGGAKPSRAEPAVGQTQPADKDAESDETGDDGPGAAGVGPI